MTYMYQTNDKAYIFFQIYDNLYIYFPINNLLYIYFQINDISYILNVSITCPKSPFVQDGHFHRIPVNDNYSAKLLPFFHQAFQFIGKLSQMFKRKIGGHRSSKEQIGVFTRRRS